MITNKNNSGVVEAKVIVVPGVKYFFSQNPKQYYGDSWISQKLSYEMIIVSSILILTGLVIWSLQR